MGSEVGATTALGSDGVLLSMRGIEKRYAGVNALRGVDFDVRAGETIALVGQNGAGKSTLVRILTGAEAPDRGVVVLDGQSVRFDSPAAALRAGVAAIHQELESIPDLSVAENLFLGRQPRRWFGIDWRAMERAARAALATFGLDIDVRSPIGSHPLAVQELVAIARAVELEARILVLDEPTASLDAREVQSLFRVLGRLKAHGVALVFIGHRLDEVFHVADRLTVLRDGERVGTFTASSVTPPEIVRAMLGRELGTTATPTRADPASQRVVLEARGVGREHTLEPCDLEVRAGEVVGLVGLLGSGRTEMCELLSGVLRPTRGSVLVLGRRTRPGSIRSAVDRGLAHVPEERKQDGIVARLSVRENIVLARERRFGRASRAAQRALAEGFVRALGIACSSVEQAAGTLSGGNQQKVLLARWLSIEPAVLILDEPTRGIDVGAKREIEAEIRRLAEAGTGLVFVSSELDEIGRICDRVLVLHARRRVCELAGDALRTDALIAAMAGETRDRR